MHLSSISARVAAVMALFVVVTAALVGGAAVSLHEYFERGVWASSLDAEYREVVTGLERSPGFVPLGGGNLSVYVAHRDDPAHGGVPRVVGQLAPGLYDDVPIESGQASVLVRDWRDRRIFILYDVTSLESLERGLFLSVTGATALIGFAMVLLTIQLSRRALKPLADLVERVHALDPATPSAPLEPQFPHRETHLLAASIDSYSERLQDFVRRESEFINAASHELRTPIAVMSGAVDVLRAVETLPPAASRPLERLAATLAEMLETVDALLYMARNPDASKEAAGGTRLDALLPQLVADHAHLMNFKPVGISTGKLEPVELRAPEALVRIAVGNLLRNAVEHCTSGLIDVELHGRSLSIADTGPGISPEQVARTFSDNVRSAASVAPSGMGLLLVRRICQRYGWAFEISGAAGQGTVATIRF